MSHFRVVAFVPAYLPEATDLWVEAWSHAMVAIDFEARRAWFVERIASLHAGGSSILCAFDARDGRMAGLITREADGHIDQLVAGVHAWGRGAAKLLVDAAKSSAQHLYLDVNQDNSRAIAFYEREGFCRVAAGVNPASGLATWRYAWADFRCVG